MDSINKIFQLRNMARIFILLLTGYLIAGCALWPTTEKFQKKMDSWLGRTETELVSSLGIPHSSYDLKDGEKVLQYQSNRTVTIPGRKYNEAVKTHHNLHSQSGGTSGTSTTYVKRQAPPHNS